MIKLFMILLVGVEANYFEVEVSQHHSLEACETQAEMQEDVNYQLGLDFIWRCNYE